MATESSMDAVAWWGMIAPPVFATIGYVASQIVQYKREKRDQLYQSDIRSKDVVRDRNNEKYQEVKELAVEILAASDYIIDTTIDLQSLMDSNQVASEQGSQALKNQNSARQRLSLANAKADIIFPDELKEATASLGYDVSLLSFTGRLPAFHSSEYKQLVEKRAKSVIAFRDTVQCYLESLHQQ